uniref:Uncharacterized protein n=1 Tax=Pararge aegeria TaxID=116150 RepID=S4P0S5_9NEOP
MHTGGIRSFSSFCNVVYFWNDEDALLAIGEEFDIQAKKLTRKTSQPRRNMPSGRAYCYFYFWFAKNASRY